MALSEERYILFTTLRRDGTPVPTPVWVVALDQDRVAFMTRSRTGKVKRLRHTPRVTVQPCNGRGGVRAGSKPVEATARLADASEVAEIRKRIRSKYGFQIRLIAAARVLMRLLGRPMPENDTGIVIALPATDRAHL